MIKLTLIRIALFAYEKFKQLSMENPFDPAILLLKDLLGFRKRLGHKNAGYKATIKERK